MGFVTAQTRVSCFDGEVSHDHGNDVTPDLTPGSRTRRDRHGRGRRGPLLPPTVPAWRSRSEYFDDLVIQVVENLERRWAKALDGTEFAVEEVPPSDPAPWELGGAPLGRYFPNDGPMPARITIYRRPIEDRAHTRTELAILVNDIIVEQVAHLLARRPDEIDPGYNGAM